MIHTVNAVIAGFNATVAIAKINPKFYGQSEPVDIALALGELDVDNDKFTIDSNGNVMALAIPFSPVNHFIRYRVQTLHDECQIVEDNIQIRWSAIDLTPQIAVVLGEIHSLNQLLAFVTNTCPTCSYRMYAANIREAAIFDMSEDGQITLEDYYLLEEGRTYRLTIRCTDNSNQATFDSVIDLGPYSKGASMATSTVTAYTVTPLPLDCNALAPYYPTFLTDEEKEYYETYCQDVPIVIPKIGHLYEPCLSGVLEAREYIIKMEGLDATINTPQLLSFAEGETVKTLNLVGAVKQIIATRTQTTLVIDFKIKDETVTTVNMQGAALLETYITTVAGNLNDFIYSVRSKQLYSKSDYQGEYMRDDNVCYGYVGIIVGTIDSYTEPNGGEFLSQGDCLYA